MNTHDILLHERKPITGLKFSTESFNKQDQFDAWCEFTSSMCDLEAIAPPKEGFLASAESYHLGNLLLTSFQLSPMKFKYTKDIIRRANFDHWYLGVVKKGAVAAKSADRGFNATEGGTVLHSYATPFSGQVGVTNYSGLFFSRDEFWDVAGELDKAAYQEVGGPLSQIVSDFIASLDNRADKLTMQEAVAVNEAFGHLLRAMVHQTPSSLEAAQTPIAAAQFDRARRFINQNLKSPGLSPHAICASLGVSRRQLYYLFEQHGGVATYIRNRRLTACYNLLTKTTDRRLISTIAYEYGFVNLSSFYRQFQARYGFNPSEARSAWSSGLTFASSGDNTFVDWLLRVGEN